ncbi:uncharacterized protein LOC120508398 isoform X2 [Passer montanus]|nr:uncharacterized protein LOC120508398 isoform X2 [Passer montanus]
MDEISLLEKLWLKALSIPGKGEEERKEGKEEKEQVPCPGSPRIYGSSEIPSDPGESIPQKLIPLLQAVLQLLEENRKNNLSPQSPGYSSRSTLKASAARTEGLKSAENQKTTPASTTAPGLLPSPAGRSTQLQQEVQKSPGEGTASSLSPSELEEQVDALTEELLQILEDEEHFLSSKGNEDLLSYYLEITSLEKESLAKRINALEEEIAQGRKL